MPDTTTAHPRLVIAGVHSGVGKTTFTCAILAALRRRGVQVASFKAGPDYIDPTYHARAAGTPCRTLDTWMLPPSAVLTLFGRAAGRTDVSVAEGVMGLYDGRRSDPSGEGEDEGSTAHLAKLLDAPVLLVVDARGAARTVAAVVLGCQRFDPAVRLAGVLLAGISSPRHLEMVAGPIARVTSLPVLGYLPRKGDLALPARHLGLVPAAEQGVDDVFFDRLALQAEATIDLDAVLAIARQAPSLPEPPSESEGRTLFPTTSQGLQARIALAQDDAFNFYYEDSLALLRAHGATLLPFSPLRDSVLPDGIQGIYIGGGFPEMFAPELAANRSMLAAVRNVVAAGLPVYAECGGLMYLCEGIIDLAGARHQMSGVIPRWSRMGQRRAALGYRMATARRDTFLLRRGETVRGHEFHWSALDEPPGADEPAYDLASADGIATGQDGFVTGPSANVLASYIHLHFGTDSRLAGRFVDACAAVTTDAASGAGTA
jgi:cobyrinic acid a,c-diamide synthase